jgi:hypothetical protein
LKEFFPTACHLQIKGYIDDESKDAKTMRRTGIK